MAKTICLLGVDGSGKSTLVHEICEQFRQKGVDARSYYFGWQPFLPTTRLFSRMFRKHNYRITDQFNKKNAPFSILQELTLCYFFVEYLARYLYVRLAQRSSFLVFDRYFYDIYTHYSYAERSIIFPLLLNIFPRPHHLFVLDVSSDVACRRKPEMPLEMVKAHRNRYLALAQKLKAPVVLTDKPVQATVSTIMEAIG